MRACVRRCVVRVCVCASSTGFSSILRTLTLTLTLTLTPNPNGFSSISVLLASPTFRVQRWPLCTLEGLLRALARRMALATGTVAPWRPRVAVCFTGFVRNHTRLARDIDRILGDATYHAFVVAPLQHFELDAVRVRIPSACS